MGHLDLKAVTKSFGDMEVIRPTDLHIADGEFVVFVGPSGCGKSTMLRMIAGLEEITSGKIEIDGRVVNNLPPVKRAISMVFQSYALYPHMSVYENIAFPLRVAKAPEAEVKQKVQRAAEVLKLTERLDHKPGALSGGQRQRVAIGRAIVREPKVFLFDEPLSNLDAALRAEMRVELKRLHGQLKNTMIYVTHDQIEAMTMADKIVVLQGGVIEQVGSPLELYHKPISRFVAGFIGNPNMNFLPAEVIGTEASGVRLRFSGGAEAVLPVDGSAQPGQTVEVGIRPDDLKPGDEASAKLTLIPEVVERLGSQTVIYAKDKAGTDINVVAQGTVPVTLGAESAVSFDPADAHLFDSNGHAFTRRVRLEEMELAV
ncbi:ABC transporter ATP-binding protein [Pelagovum pacificum]|uniref:sn-glycerol-3-phosphate ABC transporter ATP-binding protein UgpC n=1 Tax=Pelagovum pacificum TaxID=2588711 RepID=A0A5C5GJP8_9RHOB|nr:sn-glycerol-3-phosphate ABC transporter ATP-binding protein UgpC [Pelagovum pacificum]QQA43183.1 sn-glycerol-3-phosphate ABC transporter ATP-binding protein UgpC [Pelagovum pacificum]TNY33676.1 sn-glycerol-3-phosphate ABC transporter ATP-binding protein UgpC [Pelagovum pacificum]